MKKIWSEFYEFIAKGNVVGLAIGLMMGAAFNSIITSLINDILMPIISVITSGISFEQWYIPLDGNSYESFTAAQASGAPLMTVGNFISAVINFLIVALVLFFLLKGMTAAMNATKKKEEEAPAEETPAEPSEDVKLLTEIRDLLAKK